METANISLHILSSLASSQIWFKIVIILNKWFGTVSFDSTSITRHHRIKHSEKLPKYKISGKALFHLYTAMKLDLFWEENLHILYGGRISLLILGIDIKKINSLKLRTSNEDLHFFSSNWIVYNNLKYF